MLNYVFCFIFISNNIYFSSQYIWHIFGYSKAYMNARVGKPAIIYSPTFFSHRHGYKMALVFAPYGDGDGNNLNPPGKV